MNDRVDAYFERLRGKRAVVLGIGVSNRPLIRMLLEYGAEVTACDKTPREKLDEEVLALERLGARLHVGEDYLEGLEADVVFRTPGMRPDLPQIRRLTEGGAQLTSEMEAFFEVCPCTRIAVTGSDGKTTTTTLIAKILEHAGKKVWIGGNIGQPLLPLAKEMSPEDFAVVELSSFQLMTMTSSAEVAVVTNLAPNHLDVHKSMEEYIAAKENVYLHQSPSGKLVVNMDNAITHSFVGKAKGRVEEFSRLGIPENGVYLQDGTIYRNRKKIMDAADIRIPGVHNIENYMAAACAVEGFASDADIDAVARSFGGVEHRIELVRELDGVKWYNDSKGTNVDSTIKAVQTMRAPTVLVLGGSDKHVSFDALAREIIASGQIKCVVLCGATAPQIESALLAAGYTAIEHAEKYPEMVALCRRLAAPGGNVLLSPACASFDQFSDYEQRGRIFKQLVNELQ